MNDEIDLESALIILFGIMAFGLPIAYFAYRRRHRQLHRKLKPIVDGIDGVTLTWNAAMGPKLLCEGMLWKGEFYFIMPGHGNDGALLFMAQMDRSGPRIHLRVKGLLAGFLSRWNNAAFGVPALDLRYEISVDPPSVAGSFFSPENVESLVRLDELVGRVDLDLGPHGLRVTLHKMLDELKPLSECVRACRALAARAAGEGDAGAMEVVQSTTRAEGICQICGAEMIERIVRCRKCKTRHHEACWKYLGSCSTFGCGGRRWELGSIMSKSEFWSRLKEALHDLWS